MRSRRHKLESFRSVAEGRPVPARRFIAGINSAPNSARNTPRSSADAYN